MPQSASIQLPFLRDQFLLRDNMTFLNHGSFGACPRPVLEAYQAWQRVLEAQPVEFLGRRIRGLLAEARSQIGKVVGSAPQNLVFVPNATHGVNAVAHSLKLQPGDEVLTTNHEYGAAERAWRFYCQRTGARLVRQALPLPVHDRSVLVETLWSGVTEKTRVIFLSHITSPTALCLPVREICERARKAGIITVVDGAHAPGQIDLNLEEMGVDFYAGNCHKWLCSPKGAAILYARAERQALLEPLIVSWGWQSEQPGESQFLDYFEWTGTADPSAYLSVPAAIDFQENNHWTAVRSACHILAAETRARIHELTQLPTLLPDGQEWWGQMFAAPLPASLGPAKQIHDRLWDEFRIEVPVLSWEGQTLIRVSVQAYNSPEDMQRLLDALRAMLADSPRA